MRSETEIRNKLEELEAEPVLNFKQVMAATRSRIITISESQVRLAIEIQTLKWVLGQNGKLP